MTQEKQPANLSAFKFRSRMAALDKQRITQLNLTLGSQYILISAIHYRFDTGIWTSHICSLLVVFSNSSVRCANQWKELWHPLWFLTSFIILLGFKMAVYKVLKKVSEMCFRMRRSYMIIKWSDWHNTQGHWVFSMSDQRVFSWMLIGKRCIILYYWKWRYSGVFVFHCCITSKRILFHKKYAQSLETQLIQTLT